MKVGQVLGDVRTDGLQSSAFIKSIFEPEDLVAFILHPATGERRVKGMGPRTQVYKAKELCHYVEQGMDSMVYTNGVALNVYLGLAPIKPEYQRREASVRVRKEHVAGIRTVFADLDVKSGGFSSQEQIMHFLGGLAERPNRIVTTGSGGVHAYWKLNKMVSPESGRMANERWWTYLDGKAFEEYGVHIDKLVDITRMSRLPGSVRWPKTSGEVPSPVSLLWDGGDPIALSTLLLTSTPWWERKESERRILREREKDRTITPPIPSTAGSSSTDGMDWNHLVRVSSIHDWVMDYLSWDDILPGAGWRVISEADDQGRREWVRPGGSGKSATTDWEESPNVMSLFSTAMETGLSDLHDAGIALTKYRVLLRLCFADDVERLNQWALSVMP